MATNEPSMQLETGTRSHNYYRNAVEKHWDPHEIDLAADVAGAAELPEPAFMGLKQSLALFGAGEESVTEDLAPLAVVLEDIGDQMFITTQLYEESKHTDFFDRYWREVIHTEEERRGQELFVADRREVVQRALRRTVRAQRAGDGAPPRGGHAGKTARRPTVTIT